MGHRGRPLRLLLAKTTDGTRGGLEARGTMVPRQEEVNFMIPRGPNVASHKGECFSFIRRKILSGGIF
eukprot:scaffold240_cov369-Pavlova_lutheri.AAC.6